MIVHDDLGFEMENAVDVRELLEEEDDSNPDVEINPDNLCFLIYTSGSTGKRCYDYSQGNFKLYCI